MICPCEKKGETSVVDSRPTEDGTAIRRRRMCVCGERFTTFERIQFRELMVVKKNGRKSAFDRDKLSKSIYFLTNLGAILVCLTLSLPLGGTPCLIFVVVLNLVLLNGS